MKKIPLIFILLCCAKITLAQQNLFNVPSSDITEKHTYFIQYQANLSYNSLQNNITYTYGFGKGFEAGLNVFELNFTNQTKPILNENYSALNGPLSPLIMLNFQKGFTVSDYLKIGIGTQVGSSLNYNICNFSYLNTQTSLFENRARVICGAYYSNKTFTGPGNNAGILAGLEIPAFNNKLTFTCDYLSGKNSISVGVIGLAIKLFKHLTFSAGYQYAGYRSPANNGLVFELTKI